VSAPEIVEEAERDPRAAATRLLGERPLVVERQPIRPVAGGRSFASGCMAAPFHTDSQMLLGVPPHVQAMACRRAAAKGGHSLYLDTWDLLARIEQEEPALLDALFTADRRQRFVFGDVSGPTVTRRGGSLVFTHTARPLAGDEVAARLRRFVERAPVIEVAAEAGDVILIHNHRLLHGRGGFDDCRRSFTRLLGWLRAPWPAPERWLARAVPAADLLDDHVAAALESLRAVDASDRPLAIVGELLRGAAPGLLSAREDVPEPEIYRWRDAALRGAIARLA